MAGYVPVPVTRDFSYQVTIIVSRERAIVDTVIYMGNWAKRGSFLKKSVKR
jgi:hypothetical protein